MLRPTGMRTPVDMLEMQVVPPSLPLWRQWQWSKWISGIYLLECPAVQHGNCQPSPGIPSVRLQMQLSSTQDWPVGVQSQFSMDSSETRKSESRKLARAQLGLQLGALQGTPD